MGWVDEVNVLLNGAALALLVRAVQLLRDAREVARDVRRDLERQRDPRDREGA